MREIEKYIQIDSQTKEPGRALRRSSKGFEETGQKLSHAKETQSKVSLSHAKRGFNSVVSNMNVGTEPSEVKDKLVINYVDDANRCEDEFESPKGHETAVGDKDDDLEDHSDFESVEDTSSPHADLQLPDDEKVEKSSGVSKKIAKKGSSELLLHKSRPRYDQENSKFYEKHYRCLPKRTMKSNGPKSLVKEASENNKRIISPRIFPSSKPSRVIDNKTTEETTHEMFHEASDENDNETIGTVDSDENQEREALKEKVQRLENRVEKLEEELREVAALEISLYSVISDHGSSAHKVHTPARRLCRLYIHACKHLTQTKRATIARNTVSGLILVARTCGNDVARLTFWLSNTIVLRETISQVFGISREPGAASLTESNGCRKASEINVSTVESKENTGSKQVIFDDWQETRTFTAALLKIESWIFSRIVESVWWQALTPNMLSPVEELINQKSMDWLGPTLGDHQQGIFSDELWKNVFQGAFQRLCPIRAAGHKCGCLPVLAKMVMEQCVARLDVAMFNAILRESEHQIPTDPVSDPIMDSRVLPIPAGELSFSSGAQLKNSVDNWSRWLLNSLGMETGNLSKDIEPGTKDDHPQPAIIKNTKAKCFHLLSELSELLMLPKDMLMDRSVRKEVCPSINLPVIKRILCNFTPDEFCPDVVPGEVLEALNAESFVEKLVADSAMSFPYTAATIVYSPPSYEDVSRKVAEAAGKPQLERSASMLQKKGYTSDEELDDLNSPFTSYIERSSLSMSLNGDLDLKFKDQTSCGGNARYELLREVWSM